MKIRVKVFLGRRIYELTPLLRTDERDVEGGMLISRARANKALTGKNDAQHFLKYRKAVPITLWSACLLFPGWQNDEGDIAIIDTGQDWCWEQKWAKLAEKWGCYNCLVRRVK